MCAPTRTPYGTASQQQHREQQIAAQATAVQTSQAQALQDQARYQQQATRLTGSAATLMHQLEDVLTQLATAQGVQAATLGAAGSGAGSIDGALPPFAYGPRSMTSRGVSARGTSHRCATSPGAVTLGSGSSRRRPGESRGHHPEGGAHRRLRLRQRLQPARGTSPTWSGVDPTSSSSTRPTSTLGIVDQRLISSLTDVEGFIY